ncbi:MAG TPA: (d)CMP kinase [Spirochaetota bacterium]|nr:(d)CMP kinase [Spirochaetota bacterium]
MRKIVTIDGPAGSGKSTIAKLLANRLTDYTYLDTGSLYRTVTYYLRSQNISPRDTERINSTLKKVKIQINDDKVLLNGTDITAEIRKKEINEYVAAYAKLPVIRKFVRKIQRLIGEKEFVVVDGRDIGTVVFPDAFCKFYLDANVNVRARRRLNEQNEDFTQTEDDVKNELEKRDAEDKKRPESPLKIPPDAEVIDSSDLSIDNVMEKMIEYYNKRLQIENKAIDESNLHDKKMFLNAVESIEAENVNSGTLAKGKIAEITPKKIVLDIGEKRDGVIHESEVSKLDTSAMKPGDVLDVFVLKADARSENIRVSKLEADRRSALIAIKEAYENNNVIEGVVKNKVKGGYIIDVAGNNAFCPLSEFDVKRVAHKEDYIGEKSRFAILEFNEKTGKLVVSRKKPLAKHYEKLKSDFFAKVREGEILEGIVAAIVPYGAFIEIDEGLSFLLRTRNISWKRFEKIKDVLQKGDQVKVKVKHIDYERQRLDISRKDLEQDPFDLFCAQYNKGDIISGKVRKIESFGAFVEVADGLDGLLHVSELSWTKRVEHPREVLKKGDVINVKILSYDRESRKISLSYKQTYDNPWETIEQQYPRQELIPCKIEAVAKNGIYVDIDGKYQGFINMNDISWKKEKIKLKNMFRPGDNIDAKVLGYNKAKKQIELGLKQKTANPWEDIKVNYGRGGVITGEVVKIMDNGIFAKVNDEIDGFCHISQLSKKRIDNINDEFKVGQTCKFVIQKIDEDSRKLSLSIRAYHDLEEKKNVQKYLNNSETKSNITVGDLLQK